MKKRLMSIISFAFIFMFIGMNFVDAIVLGNGVTIDPGADYSSYNDAPMAISASSGSAFVVGLRVSLLTAEGTKVSSRDYYNISVYGYSMTGTCSKVEYSKGTCQYKHENWNVVSNYSTITALEGFFTSNNLTVKISSGVSTGNLSRNYMFGSLQSGQEDNVKKAFNALLRDAGVSSTVEDYKLPNGSYNLFLEWEPITKLVILSGGSYQPFLGTTYELTHLVSAFPKVKSTCNLNPMTAFCDFGGAINKTMGCSVFLDSNNTMGSLVSANIDESKKTLFSNTSYFGGALDLNSWNSSSCNISSTTTLYNVASKANTTNGIGVIWLSELFSDSVWCEDIYKYYGKNRETICNEISSNTTFDNGFENFNKYVTDNKLTFPSDASSGITVTWYETNCGCEPPTGYNCNPKYNVASCTEGDNNTITYEDSSQLDATSDLYWENCVFNEGTYTIPTHKWSDSSDSTKPTYYDSSLGSKYCEVYCIESVYANFDPNNPTVLAGSHFTWGWSTVTSSRTCRTKSIDWATFESDLEAANDEVAKQHGLLELDDEYADESWSDSEEECGCSYDYNECGISTCSSCTETSNADGTTTKTCNSYDTSETCTGTTWNWSGDAKYSVTITYTNVSGSDSFSDEETFSSSTCSSSDPGKPTNGSQSAYSAAKTAVQTVINDMKKCYTYADNSVLNTAPAYAKIIYDSTIYDYSDDMDKDYISETSSETSDCESKSVPALDSCSGSSCTGTKTIKKCTDYKRTDSDTFTFSLKDDIYRYVLKETTNLTLQSVHSLDGKSNGFFKLNYVDIGESNFPVPFYLGSDYTGQMKIEYGKLGHAKNDKTDVDTILRTVPGQYGTYGNWICNYYVDTDFICEGPDCPGDINVIYREIDLYNPFPDINSKRRATGANWCDQDSCAWNNAVSTKYILNNRSSSNKTVTGDELYDLDPMYTFVMTPSDIIQIRRYNDQNSYTSYTGSLDGANYDYKCASGTAKNCRSEYLTKLLKDLDAENLTGTCKKDRTVYTDNSKFESCRY